MKVYTKLLLSVCVSWNLFSDLPDQGSFKEKIKIKKIDAYEEIGNTRLVGYLKDQAAGELIYKLDEKTAEICYLRVEKNMRNKGVGKELMKYFLTEVQREKCSKIEVNAALQAIGFYEKCGFTCQKDCSSNEWDNTRYCYLQAQ